MVARYKNIKAADNNSINQSSSTISSSNDVVEDENRNDDNNNSENRNNVNINPPTTQVVGKETKSIAKKLEASPTTKGSPIATNNNKQEPHLTLKDAVIPPATPSTPISARKSAKEKALAISDAKKKLAASRMAAASPKSATRGKEKSSTFVATSVEKDAVKNNNSSISGGGGSSKSTAAARARSEQLARIRQARSRSRSPIPGVNGNGTKSPPSTPTRGSPSKETASVTTTTTPKSNGSKTKSMTHLSQQPSPRAKILSKVTSAQHMSRAKIISQVTERGGKDPTTPKAAQVASLKLQRERFMRMKQAVEKPVTSSQPQPTTPSPNRLLEPTTPKLTNVQSTTNVKSCSSGYVSSPDDTPLTPSSLTTDYKTQRELYMQMRAMEKAGLEEQQLPNKTKEVMELKSPTNYDELGPTVSYSTSVGTSDSCTDLGDIDTTVFMEEDEEEETNGAVATSVSDPPLLKEEVTTSVSEESESYVGNIQEEEETDDIHDDQQLGDDVVQLLDSGEDSEHAVLMGNEANDVKNTKVVESSMDSFPNAFNDVDDIKVEKAETMDITKMDSFSNAFNDIDDNAFKIDNVSDNNANDIINAFKNSDTVKAFLTDTLEEGDSVGFQTDPFKSSCFGDFQVSDWPTDNFSPTSWGSQSDGFGNGDEWNVTFPMDDGAEQVESNQAVDDVKGKAKGISVQRGDDCHEAVGNNDAKNEEEAEIEEEEEENLIWNSESDDFGISSTKVKSNHDERRDDIQAMGEKEIVRDLREEAQESSSGSFEWDRVGEGESVDKRGDFNTKNVPNEHQSSGDVRSECSTVYEGFGTVLDSDKLICKESMDDDESVYNDEEHDEFSKASEGTVGSATEFDPLSMFGEADEVPPIEDDVDNNTAAESNNPASTFSWTSPSVIKPSDGTNSISFPSLNSGSQLKIPTQPTSATSMTNTHMMPMKAPVPSDSPAGTESLESWWQSRYASTQHSDINSAVQEALMKRVESPKVQCTKEASEPEFSDLSHKQPDIVKDSEANKTALVRSEQQQAPRSEVTESQKKHEPQSDEEDSIFSGLDEDCSLPSLANRQTAKKSRTQSINKTETDEDIFSGVSVTSRSQFPRLKESNAMKSVSLLDGASTVLSTAESPAQSQQPKNAASKQEENKSSPMIQKETPNPSSRLFLPDTAGYGVIDCQKSDNSPTNASVTSELTSSVIDFSPQGRKPSFRKLASQRSVNVLETTDEMDQELSAIRSADQAASKVEEEEYEEDVDMINSKSQETPLSQEDDNSKSPTRMSTSRGVSLVNPSTNDDSATYPSISSKTNSKVSEVVEQAKSTFLSQFACGVFSASSFTFCAPNGNADARTLSSLDENTPNSDEDQADDEGSKMVLTKGSHTIQGTIDGTVSEESEDGSDGDDDDDQYSRSRSSHSGSSSDRGTKSTYIDERTVFTEGMSLSMQQSKKLAEKYDGVLEEKRRETPDDKKQIEIDEERANAHEKLLLYAYAALSVPPPTEIVEKGEGTEKPVVYPSVLSPKEAIERSEAMSKLLVRLRDEGMEVLKLNRDKKWHPRFLTITKEVMSFTKSDDVRFKGVDSCPRGLLWLKKFESKAHTVASISGGKNGKGGILFNEIEHVSVTNDNHSLSRTQRKGKFKDSITFVLHTTDTKGTKRDILFRCMSKEDAFALSSGFQAILDRISALDNSKSTNKKQMKVDTTSRPPSTPLASNKASSPKAVASPVAEDRWEV